MKNLLLWNVERQYKALFLCFNLCLRVILDRLLWWIVYTVPGCVVKIYKYGMHSTSAMHWLNVNWDAAG
jgi:hypothetical protein